MTSLNLESLNQKFDSVNSIIYPRRNRYTTCIELKLTPIVKQWDGKGSLLEFVSDMNFNRRQMDASQRAMGSCQNETTVRGRSSETADGNTISWERQRWLFLSFTLQSGEPKEITKGETNDIVGKMVGVSGKSVRRASNDLPVNKNKNGNGVLKTSVFIRV